LSEALFYHLEKRRLEDVLPGLVEKSLERGWRAIVRTESADRASALDALLWTFDEESFLPHAVEGSGNPAAQPVLITAEEGNLNNASVLFLVGGARIADWNEAGRLFARTVVLFDGRDPAAVQIAREDWKAVKAAGLEATYWKESAAGKFERQQ